MREFYKEPRVAVDAEAIAAVPSREVARWAVRLNRIDYATGRNNTVMRGGSMSDDGQLISLLARESLSRGDWQDDPLYDQARLYELKGPITPESVDRAARPFEGDPAYDRLTNRTWEVGRLALRDSYQTVGLLEGDEDRLTAPVAAMAALCLERADIDEPADRELSGRRTEIVDMTHAIGEQARMRALWLPGNDGTRQPVSLYELLPYASESLIAKYNESLGYAARTGQQLWWSELANDLGRIDSAAAGL